MGNPVKTPIEKLQLLSETLRNLQETAKAEKKSTQPPDCDKFGVPTTGPDCERMKHLIDGLHIALAALEKWQ